MKKKNEKKSKYVKSTTQCTNLSQKREYSAHEHAHEHVHMSDICCLYSAHAWVYLGGVGCVSVVSYFNLVVLVVFWLCWLCFGYFLLRWYPFRCVFDVSVIVCLYSICVDADVLVLFRCIVCVFLFARFCYGCIYVVFRLSFSCVSVMVWLLFG